MKKLIIILLVMCFALTMPCESKIVKRGNNWIQVDSTSTKKSNKPADKVVGIYTDKSGKKYPVYQGPKGGYYYINKNGKKTYLPKK